MENNYYVPFTREMKKTYTILAPNMLPMHFRMIAEILRGYGYKMEILQTTGRRIAETGALRTVHVDNAHNVYLGCSLDLGRPALSVLLAYLAAAFARWLRGRNQTLRPAFGLGVCACAVQACFGLGLCLTAPVFLILLALTAVPSDRSTEVDPWTTN